MKTKILILLVIAVTVNACTKDKFTTAPQLTLTSVNSISVGQGDVLTFTFEFTDKEGDIQDSLFIKRTSLVCPGVPVSNLSSAVPQFPSTSKQSGILEVTYNIGTAGGISLGTPCSGGLKTDTSIFKFCLRDKAGNKSDTITSPKIAIRK